MTSVTISVIIPTLNEEKSLPQTLACLSASGVTEVVIVDGGSLDKTISIAEAFCAKTSNARIVTAPAGRARQMNEGAKVSQGDILLFLHADTQLPVEARLMIEAALTNPAVGGGPLQCHLHPSFCLGNHDQHTHELAFPIERYCHGRSRPVRSPSCL